MSFWLTTKLNEICVCGSGKAYHIYCLRPESACFFIMIVAAAALCGTASEMDVVTFFKVLIAVLVVAGGLGCLATVRLKK
jgi:hypothetical protein